MGESKCPSLPPKLGRVRYYGIPIVWVMFGLWLIVNLFLAHRKDASTDLLKKIGDLEGKVLSREKRFIYLDNNRQLSLPPGAILAFSLVISLPFMGNLPVGYGSGLTIAVPFTIKFDDLGLTSEDNRFGYVDFYNLRGYLGLPTLNVSALRLPSIFDPVNFPTKFYNNLPYIFTHGRGRRSTWNNFPGVNYAGGDREMVYQVAEDFLHSFGIDGQGCVLRAICEMHEEPLINHGFFGEVLELLLSPSLAAFAEYRLGPYLEAEKRGKEVRECSMYHSMCKYSLFSPKSGSVKNQHANFTIREDDVYYNSIDDSPFRNGSHHRQKRVIMFGPARRILFPPNTAVVVTPTLNLPFLRDLPAGFKSQLSYSIPFTLDFDALGYTSILNEFGYIPFYDGEKEKLKKGKKANGEEKKKKKKKRRRKGRKGKREVGEGEWEEEEKEEEEETGGDADEGINIAGGDREMMFMVVADSLSNIGIDGAGCLLRAICEVHETPLPNHGLFGEVLQLFLTPSLAPNAEKRLDPFLKAERRGKKCGDCSIYGKFCPKSLFTNPGAGIQYRSKEVITECKKRLTFAYREENMNFVQDFKSKYKKVKKESKPSTIFVKEIADDLYKKRLFESY